MTTMDQWGSLISRKAPFDPIFGSSSHLGLIKRANAAHLGQNSPRSRRRRKAAGAELDRPHQTTDGARRTSVGAEQGVLRFRMTKRGIPHCFCKPGLLHFNVTHEITTILTRTGSYTITMGSFLSRIFIRPSISRLLWTQKSNQHGQA